MIKLCSNYTIAHSGISLGMDDICGKKKIWVLYSDIYNIIVPIPDLFVYSLFKWI